MSFIPIEFRAAKTLFSMSFLSSSDKAAQFCMALLWQAGWASQEAENSNCTATHWAGVLPSEVNRSTLPTGWEVKTEIPARTRHRAVRACLRERRVCGTQSLALPPCIPDKSRVH